MNTNYRLISVVWGKDFTDTFLKVSLPSLLSPCNLVFLSTQVECIFRIYTTSKYAKVICSSEIFKKLSEIMTVQIAEFVGLSHVTKYQIPSQCHHHFMKSFAHEDCAFIIIWPDTVWADGSFARILEIERSGKRAVVLDGPRLIKETFVPSFLEFFNGKDGVCVYPRQLVKLAMKHLHPESLSMFWGSVENSTTYPSNLFWLIKDEGLLMRQFYMNPVMVRPEDKTVFPEHNVDSAYLFEAFSNMDDIYIVCDSDDICMIDLTSVSDRQESIKSGGQSVSDIARWADQNTHQFHREFVKQRVKFHWSDLSENWKHIEANSDEVVNDVLSLLNQYERTEYFAPGSAAHKPSASRYFTPRFWLEKIHRLGLGGLLKKSLSSIIFLILQFLFGTEIKIKTIRNANL